MKMLITVGAIAGIAWMFWMEDRGSIRSVDLQDDPSQAPLAGGAEVVRGKVVGVIPGKGLIVSCGTPEEEELFSHALDEGVSVDAALDLRDQQTERDYGPVMDGREEASAVDARFPLARGIILLCSYWRERTSADGDRVNLVASPTTGVFSYSAVSGFSTVHIYRAHLGPVPALAVESTPVPVAVAQGPSYLLWLGGKDVGPLSLAQIRAMVVKGAVNSRTPAVQDGRADWRTVGDLR
jgi:hypothetical protein